MAVKDGIDGVAVVMVMSGGATVTVKDGIDGDCSGDGDDGIIDDVMVMVVMVMMMMVLVVVMVTVMVLMVMVV